MATKRLLVSVEENTFDQIQHLAKLSHLSASRIAKDLINNSLELAEDELFSKLADERLKETKGWISHEDAWK